MKRIALATLGLLFLSTGALAQYETPAVNSPLFPSTPTSGQFPVASSGTAADWKSMSGDATLASTGALTFGTVNTNVGSFGSATQCVSFTVNAKGLLTAASATACTPGIGSITGLGTNVATLLGGAASGTGGPAGTVSPAFTGFPTAPTQAIGDTSTDIATDAFVASAINAQVDMKDPVKAATTSALIFSPTYSNGSSGVGATLTATTVGVLVIDGVTPALGDRILVQNQASTFQNGCYTVTTLGVVITTDYVLTRCVDYDQTAEIVYGTTFPVLQGSANANQQFTMNNNASITVGTTGITFAQTSGGSQLVAGTGINITGNTISATGTGSVASFNSLTGAVTTNIVVQKFTTTSTYTPTSGMLHAIIECIGSGAGGGGITGNATGILFSGGGGSGSYSMKRVAAADIVGTAAITVGAAGAGGVAGNNAGSAGGDVTVVSNAVSLCVGKGGSGGAFANSSTVAGGGSGGVAGTGDVAAQGNYGQSGYFSSVSTNVLPSGSGGSSVLGGGANNPVCTSAAAVAGTAAGPFGAGGGGACATVSSSTAAGGAGSGGIVIITEFINM